jgi:hypothetical protein
LSIFDPNEEVDESISTGLDKITGPIQKAQNIEFWTKDSGKLTSLYKLLLIGLFLSDEK